MTLFPALAIATPRRRREPRRRRHSRGVRAMSEPPPTARPRRLGPRARLQGARGRPARCCAASRFSIERGQSYGLVGESGCGKSTAALAIVRYLPRNGRVSGGSVTVAGRDVHRARRPASLRDYHARTVSMVYQNPGSALNPSMRVGAQVAEAFTVLGVSKQRGRRSRPRQALEQGADRRPRRA